MNKSYLRLFPVEIIFLFIRSFIVIKLNGKLMQSLLISKTFNILLFLFFILPASVLATNTSGSTANISNKDIVWHEWSNESFKLAREQNKLVLLDISAQWCQFCKKMKAVTYQDNEVINIINKNFIAIKSDIEKTSAIKKRYGNFGVPGTVILTANKKEINKRLGYIAPQQMQWHLLGNLQDAPGQL
jgi:thiol:disulfide interchange protein